LLARAATIPSRPEKEIAFAEDFIAWKEEEAEQAMATSKP